MSDLPSSSTESEALRLLRIVAASSMGAAYPVKKEKWIGWQEGDADPQAVQNLKIDVRNFLSSAPSETVAPLDALAALMLKEDGMDVDICSPGNHGGRGADADKWLVTLMPADHNNIREFFGATLAEAIREATL